MNCDYVDLFPGVSKKRSPKYLGRCTDANPLQAALDDERLKRLLDAQIEWVGQPHKEETIMENFYVIPENCVTQAGVSFSDHSFVESEIRILGNLHGYLKNGAELYKEKPGPVPVDYSGDLEFLKEQVGKIQAATGRADSSDPLQMKPRNLMQQMDSLGRQLNELVRINGQDFNEVARRLNDLFAILKPKEESSSISINHREALREAEQGELTIYALGEDVLQRCGTVGHPKWRTSTQLDGTPSEFVIEKFSAEKALCYYKKHKELQASFVSVSSVKPLLDYCVALKANQRPEKPSKPPKVRTSIKHAAYFTAGLVAKYAALQAAVWMVM